MIQYGAVVFCIAVSLAAAVALSQPQVLRSSGSLPSTQRQAIEKVIHDYLLEHPDILPRALKKLETGQLDKLLAQMGTELETPFYGAVDGNPNGDVTLVVFFDFRCPYCQIAKARVDALIQQDPQLRVVYRDFPILDHPGAEMLSRRAAELALAAARQNKYRAFHDAVFAAPKPFTLETIIKAARTAGLDEAAAVSDAQGPEVRAALDRNIEMARLLGIAGTPAYVLGRQVLSGADKPAQMPATIAALRAQRPAF